MKEKLTIVKVGGKIVEDEASLQRLILAFAQMDGLRLLVHGGGRTATDVAKRLGVETVMVEGRRVTDQAMLEVVTMVYGGLVNKRVVAALQAASINAIGLTGADMNVMLAHRRPTGCVDYGFVGDVDKADGEALARLLQSGVVPVMAPLTHDGHGQLLNTNADTIAGETAKALAHHFEVTLVYCFEHAGVLKDANDEESLIPTINRASFEALVADGTVSGGMIPKIENCLQAVEQGVACVVITAADTLGTDSGTVITQH